MKSIQTRNAGIEILRSKNKEASAFKVEEETEEVNRVQSQTDANYIMKQSFNKFNLNKPNNVVQKNFSKNDRTVQKQGNFRNQVDWNRARRQVKRAQEWFKTNVVRLEEAFINAVKAMHSGSVFDIGLDTEDQDTECQHVNCLDVDVFNIEDVRENVGFGVYSVLEDEVQKALEVNAVDIRDPKKLTLMHKKVILESSFLFDKALKALVDPGSESDLVHEDDIKRHKLDRFVRNKKVPKHLKGFGGGREQSSNVLLE